MNRLISKYSLTPAVLLLFFLSSCSAPAPQRPYEPGKTVGATKTQHMFHSIQAGAFRNFSNAIAYKNRLSRVSDAYCFKDRDGLFKVRIGNFKSAASAQKKARELASKGIINDYFIFRPESYAASRAKNLGSGYLRDSLVQTTKRYLGVTYRWGGTSAGTGFDCSGLTMTVYRQNGIRIPRTAAQQFRAGTKISSRSLKKGDLLFFSDKKWNKKNNITHVALYIGDGKLIHAPGSGKKVRVDLLEKSYFQKHLAGVRTYL